jgi:hypothetical protein
MMTPDEAVKIFLDAAVAAEDKLPPAVAVKLTDHLRRMAEIDFSESSTISQVLAGAWIPCAQALVAMPPACQHTCEGASSDGNS